MGGILTERGQICALGVNSYVLSPMLKNRLSRLSNWAVVILSRPVFESATAPVRLWYVARASAEHAC